MWLRLLEAFRAVKVGWLLELPFFVRCLSQLYWPSQFEIIGLFFLQAGGPFLEGEELMGLQIATRLGENLLGGVSEEMDFVDITAVLPERLNNLHELGNYFGRPPGIFGHFRPNNLL